MRFYTWAGGGPRPESWPADEPFLTESAAYWVADAERAEPAALMAGTTPGPDVVALVAGQPSHAIGGWSISLYLDTSDGFERVAFDDAWSQRARAGYSRTRERADRWEWEAPAAIGRGLAAVGRLMLGGAA